MIDIIALHLFNFMLGFAWHKEIKRFEVFIGLFAICWDIEPE